MLGSFEHIVDSVKARLRRRYHINQLQIVVYPGFRNESQVYVRGRVLVGKAIEVKGVKVLATTLEGADATALRESMDKLKDKLKSAAIVLATTSGGKVNLIAGVTADLTGRIKAGELVNFVAQQVGGKGGGRPDMAQAGGKQPEKLPAALETAAKYIEGALR